MSDQLSHDLASLRIDRSEVPPSRARGCLVAILLAGALTTGALLALRAFGPTLAKPTVAVTEIVLVSPAQTSVELTATGYVVPQRQTRVSSKILGRIEQMRVKEGERVRAGDVLYTIEDREQRAALAVARSSAKTAVSRIAVARASLAEGRLQYERDRSLTEKDLGPLSQAEDRLARLKVLEEALVSAEAEAAGSQDEIKAREVDLANTVVTAPFDGVVLGKPLERGELLGTFNEKPAVELGDPLSFVVEADVAESRVAKVRPGGPAEIVLDAFPGRRFRGLVLEVGSRVNRAKASVVVKVSFVDPLDGVLPEMAARVNFLARPLEARSLAEAPKLFVAKGAVVKRGGATVVFMLDEGQVRLTPVTVLGEIGDGLELKAGPQPGVKVVVDPPESLEDGQRIKEKSN